MALSDYIAISPEYEQYLVTIVVPLLIGFLLKRLWAAFSDGRSNDSSRVEPDGKVVLITGADTGFGSLAAVRLVHLGYHVFAGCLNAETAATSAWHVALKDEFPDKIHLLQMDVTNDEQVNEAAKTVSTWLSENPALNLHAVVNNAGILYPMVPLELYSMASFSNLVDVNVYGALRVFKAFVPVMRSGGVAGGRLVVMGSLASELACPMMGAYCASKWALSAICDTLRFELNRFGIYVSVVMPDLYRTQLVTNKQMLYSSLEREVAKMDETAIKAYGGDAVLGRMRWFVDVMEQYANPNLSPVVDTIAEAVSSRRPQKRYYPISWKSKVVTTLARWFPSLLDNMVCIGQVV